MTQELTSKILNQIAQEINSGFNCCFNVKTHEIISIPDFDQFCDEEYVEIFQEDLKKVNSKSSGFIKIEKLTSAESFRIMNNFTEQLNDQKLKKELEIILENRKPFQNFKNKIDNSDFRESWFKFKQSETEKTVKNKISEI